MSNAHWEKEVGSPLEVGQILKQQVPVFVESPFAQAVDKLLNPEDTLTEANRVINSRLTEYGGFVDVTEHGEEGVSIRREIDYRFRLAEALQKGLIDPVMLSMLQTTWAVLEGSPGKPQPEVLEVNVTDLVPHDSPDDWLPPGAKYHLSVGSWPGSSFGGISLRTGDENVAFGVHSGSAYHLVSERKALDEYLFSVSKTPRVSRTLALHFVQTFTNPDLIAIGETVNNGYYMKAPKLLQPVGIYQSYLKMQKNNVRLDCN